MKTEQKWIGRIIKITKKRFLARLEDITNGGTDEMAYFNIKDYEDLKEHIKMGAVFDYIISSENTKFGITQKMVFKFHHHKITKKEIEIAKQRADELFKTFKKRIDYGKNEN